MDVLIRTKDPLIRTMIERPRPVRAPTVLLFNCYFDISSSTFLFRERVMYECFSPE